MLNVLDWATRNAELCNLFSTIAVLVPGLILLIAKAQPLRAHRFAVHAFGFWILQWVTFLFLYICLSFVPGSPPSWLPALVDLQSVFALGFCAAFLHGDDYEPGPVWIALLIVFAIFAAVDIGFGLKAVGQPAGSSWRYAWIATSEVFSATVLVMQGAVFVLRYGAIAYWLLVANVLYASLQRPIYSGVFVTLTPHPRWFLLAAVGKLLTAALFYLFFFSPIAHYTHLRLPPPDHGALRTIKGRLKKLGLILGPIALFLVEEVLRRTFFK